MRVLIACEYSGTVRDAFIAQGHDAMSCDLLPTDIVGKGARHVTKSGKSLPQWYNLPPSADRWKIRSATFQGIADAMAAQW
jgi:hypothetical protein